MSDTLRPKMTGVYLNTKERSLLRELANDAGMTMSAYVRWLIRQADHNRKPASRSKKRVAEYA